MRKRNELRQLEHLPSQKKAQVIEHGVPTYHFSAYVAALASSHRL